MLEPWAIGHKGLKKRVAWWLYQRQDLAGASVLHATSNAEAYNLAQLKLGVPVRIIPNGIDLPDAEVAPSQAPRKKEGVRTALFVGRLYPVKGLPMLVEAWARERPPRWRLRIAGPDEAGHRRDVENAIAGAGLEDSISFDGPLEGEAKAEAFRAADLFVLPTLSESFGIVIAEALSYGIPVLTTTAAPWPTLSEHGCGWRVAPTVDGLSDGLRLATAAAPNELRSMGSRGRELVHSQLRWDLVASQFIQLYAGAARASPGSHRGS